ncbi:YcnI family protein [Castellaniella sp.]|uniref:YcnI family copper-binding membrane protein n=1 Tax=Castellaniella sp. TaxID=1955812 RepID=UPI003C77898E
MSIFRTGACAAAACAALLFAPSAFSHITLETQQAPVGASYKAVMRVPHGCQGSATVKLRIQIPAGFLGVKPQPKAGWQLTVVKGDYSKPYDLYGSQVDSGVTEVDWAGGPLPDDFYDEFVFRGYISSSLKPGSTLYFPVIQECEKGVDRWIDIPDGKEKAHGHDDHGDTPAPGLKLLPKAK